MSTLVEPNSNAAGALARRFGSIGVAIGAPAALLFGLTLFLSSTLLFFVEPMFAKLLLPRLGGTAAVWNTCLVFFQACLLAGYAYSHAITRRLRVKHQVIVHAFVLALPLLLLPVALPKNWNPPVDANPVPWLLLLLTVSVGLPFFVVSTTAPLVQRWFSSAGYQNSADPYFLYAASNIGSMVALLSYPTIVEPLLRLGDQSQFWTFGYIAFAVLTLTCGILAARRGQNPSAASSDSISIDAASDEPIGLLRRLRWIALAAVPSSYLLGVTTYITTDVAAVPMLWVLPLALYLLTFILVFARRPMLSHRVMVIALPTAVLVPVLFLLTRAALPVWAGVASHLIPFFVCAMVCHGELARSRPGTRLLTDFYLMMSLGGVLGGAFNALAAPLLFTRALEYPLAIVLACLLCPPRSLFSSKSESAARTSSSRRITIDWTLALAVGLLAWIELSLTTAHATGMPLKFLGLLIPMLLCVRLAGKRFPFAFAIAGLLLVAAFFPSDRAHLLEIRRSFFGVHRVTLRDEGPFHELFHGTTLHGRQHIDAAGNPQRPDEALTYYHATGPCGDIIAALASQQPQTVAVIGLGVGSIAAYAKPGDHYAFYEIDPVVRWAANESGYFNYLAAARQRGADVQIIMGDGRRTLTTAAPRSLDLLVLDAFSGDAIPLHLLTREALAGYLEKLKDTGLIAVHISNMYCDLEPVVANLAADAGCVAVTRGDLDITPEQSKTGKTASKWMVIARTRRQLPPLLQSANWIDAPPKPSLRMWTDDYSNFLAILR